MTTPTKQTDLRVGINSAVTNFPEAENLPLYSDSHARRTSARKTTILVIACILAGCILAPVILSLPIQGELYGNLLVQTTSTAAAVISVLAYRIRTERTRRESNYGMQQGTDSKDHRNQDPILFLMIGLIFWCSAESIWNYYVYGLEVDVPYPSVADIFYLSGYPFLAYFMYRVSKIHGLEAEKEDKHDEAKFIGTAVAITVVAFIVNLFLLQIVESSIGSIDLSQNGVITLILSLTYPVLDASLAVPSIIILYDVFRNRRTRPLITPQTAGYIMISAAMLLQAIADTGFGYSAVEELGMLSEATWNVIFGISYLLISGYMAFGMLERQVIHKDQL